MSPSPAPSSQNAKHRALAASSRAQAPRRGAWQTSDIKRKLTHRESPHMPTQTPNETSSCHKCSQQQLPSVNTLSCVQPTTDVHDAADTSPRTNATWRVTGNVGRRHQRTPGTDDTAKGNTRQLPEIWQTHDDAQHSTTSEERHANGCALLQRKHVRIRTRRGRHLIIYIMKKPHQEPGHECPKGNNPTPTNSKPPYKA